MGKKDHFTWRKPALMTKVLAYYIHNVLFPSKLAFFKEFGFKYTRCEKYKLWMDSYNKDFWVAFLVCVTFFSVAWQFSPLGTLIFFFGIGIQDLKKKEKKSKQKISAQVVLHGI